MSSTKTKATNYLCEALISTVVTGIDDSVWTALGLVDTYFDEEESTKTFQAATSSFSRPDPLSAGVLDAQCPILDPREYFLKVFEIRVSRVEKEWHFIVQKLRRNIEE